MKRSLIRRIPTDMRTTLQVQCGLSLNLEVTALATPDRHARHPGQCNSRKPGQTGGLNERPSIQVLLIVDQGKQKFLRERLAAHKIAVRQAANCEELFKTLASAPDVSTVLTDYTLPGGETWCTACDAVRRSGARSVVLVCTGRYADGPWSEVVQRGGYYALAAPQRNAPIDEVLRSIISAAGTQERSDPGAAL